MLLTLAGCAGNMGGVPGGPKPFGGKEYKIAPPRVSLSREVKVVVMLLDDERPPMDHELDWVGQANPFGNTMGQPKEVGKEFDRAIKAGLVACPNIRLVAPEMFLETRDADLVISGRILRCEAEKTIGPRTVDIHGRARVEIVLRNGQGNAIGNGPLAFAKDVLVPWKSLFLNAWPDEPPPGYTASAVEKAIQQVVESFLASKELAEVLAAWERP
ncbi:MAG: hypothetical protein A2521_08360 [Deltaproteobacteria bacterium RIFOXYD12_FULL_57_12]|nr:MAG: hypothetical protein A2521_08360 [Deltaproteobacteria bacterium RIFOXYD12_FULL_57_12]